MKKKGVDFMKKLYYSAIILLVAIIALVMPKAKAAGDFDCSASYIGFIDSYQTDSSGNIIGAYVYITESSLEVFDYDIGYFFVVEYFQPDITLYGYDLIGKPLIWNSFDDRGAFQVGAWWLLIDYQQMLQDMWDEFSEGYLIGGNEGYEDGLADGYSIGYDEGYYNGSVDAFDSGYSLGYDNGFADGYQNGFDDAYNEIISSDEYTLGYNDGFKSGEKSKIVKNNEAFYGGIEKWLVPAIIVVLVGGGIMSISALKRREQ